MSAISAVFHLEGSPIDTAPLERMVAFQQAQGPDGRSNWAGGPAGLGHNLFRATFESAHEAQPFSIDGQAWICLRHLSA